MPITDAAKAPWKDHEWIDAKDVAKLIRKRLKVVAPGVKTSVRLSRYSGGSSIHVSVPRGTDATTFAAIAAAADTFSGGSFDGMIDLAYGWSSWLTEDGEASIAYCGGTTGSGGVVGVTNNPPPKPGARLVQFASKYVFTQWG